MEIKQVYTLVNSATSEALGGTAILNEDLSNVVDTGDAVFNANSLDKYVRALVSHIGRVIFVNRAYRGGAPSVLMDGWEFGSVLEKIRMEMPDATENETWSLNNGSIYEQDQFYQPKVAAKFFDKRVTFEVPLSFTEKQVKSSFSSPEQLNAFVSMLYNGVERAMTVKIDALTMRTINNFIGETVFTELGANNHNASSGVRAVNLLKLYNDSHAGTALTAANALNDPNFIRYASLIMKLYQKRLGKLSKLFNIGKTEKFTPEDMLHVVLLADFESAARVYLYGGAGQFSTEDIRLPEAETVAYWQGSGTSYAFEDTSKVDIKTSAGNTIVVNGILGVMFDRDALGVSCLERRTTTHYNAKGEFFNNYAKMEAGYYNDFDENFVVFFVA